MYLETDLSPLQILELELLQPDPGVQDYGIVQTPFDFQIAGLTALYVIRNNATRLISLGEIVFLSQNRLRIPLVPVPSVGSKILALCDFNCGFKFDCLDRQLIDGHTYLNRSFTLTNANDLVEYGSISVLSIDMDTGLKWPYPYVKTNVAYSVGVCDQNLNLLQDYNETLNDFCVFFNSLYIGRLSSHTGSVSSTYTSPKTGKVEIVKVGKLQFSLDGLAWDSILGISRMYPRDELTVYVRCNITSLTQIRHLNGIKIFATEEVT